ncbi:hypothetical protein ACFX14_006156 [Malus domestica]
MVIPLRCFKNWICASIRHVSQDFELSLYTNSQLKVSYNTQDKSWDIDELIAQCVQEETRQKQERGKDVETVNFVQVGKGKKFNNAGNNSGKNFKYSKPSDKTGHLRKDCELFKDYLRANGKEVVNVYEESFDQWE